MMGLVLVLLGCQNLLRTAGPPTAGMLPAITAQPLAALPSPEGQVRVLQLGARAIDLSAFADEQGCTVSTTTRRRSYGVWSEVHAGDYDVVISPSDVSRRLILDDVLQPLNPALIAGWPVVDDGFRQAPWNQFEGQPFGVPLHWGPHGLLVNAEAFDELPDSWRVLYDPSPLIDGDTTAGRVQVYEGAMELATTILTLRAHDPDYAGIEDPFAVIKGEFFAAGRAVRRQRSIVASYWQDPDQQVAEMASGRIVAATGWRYQARELEAQGVPVVWSIPKEGATAWALTAMVPRSAANPGCAYRLIDFALRADVQRSHAQALASVPVNSGACRVAGAPSTDSDLCTENGAADRATLHFWRSPDRLCDRSDECATWSDWVAVHTLALGGL